MAKWINKTNQPLSEVEKFINDFMDRPEAIYGRILLALCSYVTGYI